jgi:hypothetical protein
MRLLRIIAPYLFVAIAAIAVFVAGAYSGFRFASDVIYAPELGQDVVASLADRTRALSLLDSNDPEGAHASLVLAQDGDLLLLDGLSPYLRKETAVATCNLFRRIAKLRADNPARYPKLAKGFPPDPTIAESINRALNSPQACARSAG